MINVQARLLLTTLGCSIAAIVLVGTSALNADQPVDAIAQQTIASGLSFPEGPVLSKDGKTLYCVNVQKAFISRIDLRKHATDIDWVTLPGAGRGNGAALGPDGALYVADVGRARIVRIDTKRGDVTDYVTANDTGKPLLGPNDCAFDKDGGLYFTDPNGSSAANPIGALYYVEAGTHRVNLVKSGLAYPNGVAVAADGKTVYVAESPRKVVDAIPIYGQLQWGAPTKFANVGETGGPDGMRAAPDGTLYVASYGDGMIFHLSATGARLETIPITAGKNTTNLCLADGGKALFVTETQSNTIVKVSLTGRPERP